ncbi:hypothetical protein ACVWZL_004842 [Bradyrhizobium sp. GM2.4]
MSLSIVTSYLRYTEANGLPKLRIGALPDDKPVKVTTEIPASVHRDLVAYAEALAIESGQRVDPAKLIAPMLARIHGHGSRLCEGTACDLFARIKRRIAFTQKCEEAQ